MLKGLGAMGDMAKMMKAAGEMKNKMEQLQEDMHNMLVTGESGAGLVKATCTAKGELVRAILFPKPTEFRFSQDAFKFVGVLFLLSLIGIGYTFAIMVSACIHRTTITKIT